MKNPKDFRAEILAFLEENTQFLGLKKPLIEYAKALSNLAIVSSVRFGVEYTIKVHAVAGSIQYKLGNETRAVLGDRDVATLTRFLSRLTEEALKPK
ncbi:MAG: hypothetical protein AAB632_00995 [Patescibacteria group bacterium]